MSRLLIREAHLHEYADIRRFYSENPDPHVMFRGEDEVKNAIDEGVFFLCIDPSASEKDRIVAASAVYSVTVPNDLGVPIVLKEAGGSLVRREFRGLGIHNIFHWARSLHKFILDRNGFVEYFGAIIMPNDESEKNAARAGFVPWNEAPQRLRDERSIYIDATTGQSLAFYRLPIAALQAHANSLLSVERLGLLECRRNGLRQVEINFDLEILKRYRRILTDITEKGAEAALAT